MKIYLAAFLAAFAASFVLTALLTPLLKRLKAGQYILGYVKEHKDKGGTPTMGGFAFITTVIVLAPAFYGVGNRTVNLTLVIVGGFMFVGFLDDFLKIYRKDNQGLRPYQKIIFQTAIAAIASVYCYMNGLTVLEIPFGSAIVLDIGAWVIPLTLFVFLATVNCVNLTDGLDGLAGGTGMAFLSEICDIARFRNAEQLAAYIGMIPMCHSSGEKDGTGDITVRRNVVMRCNLIEAAWVAVRQDPAMNLFFTEQCKRMPKSKAIVKVARKLVNRLYFVLKHQTDYVNSVMS